MKKLIFFATLIFAIGCKQKPATTSENTASTKKYTLTFITEQYNKTTKKLDERKVSETIESANDTTAYLAAVKNWYAKKIDARANLHFGLYKSYSIIDQSGLDLSVKLSEQLVSGIDKQVRAQPEVKQLIDETNRDSLPY